jgi:hypothetical protein
MKYPKDFYIVNMELTPFSNSLAKYLPEDLQVNEGFVKYVKGTLYESTEQKAWYSSILYDYVNWIIYTLPSPRYKYFQSSSFTQVQNDVLEEL